MPGTVDDIYDHEGAIEGAFKYIIAQRFTAVGLSVPVYISRDTADLATPRVELMLVSNGSLAQRTTEGQSEGYQRLVPNAWQGAIMASVVTTRDVNAQRSLHRKIRSQLRYVMSGANAQITNVQLPYHQILDLVAGDFLPIVDQEKNTDITRHTYPIQWAIKNGAWPSTP